MLEILIYNLEWTVSEGLKYYIPLECCASAYRYDKLVTCISLLLGRPRVASRCTRALWYHRLAL
jgi:hypothetical protein